MAGESAQREYERLREHRRAVDARVLPWIVGVALVLAVGSYVVFERYAPIGYVGPILVIGSLIPFFGPSQRETAWRRGAEGERIVGASLDALQARGCRTLHDRRMPRSRANLDHITAAPGQVCTVDAKRYSGRIEVQRGRLVIAGRDRSKLLDQALRQRDAVRVALDTAGHGDVPVVPVLCFSGVEWPLLFRPRRVGDVRICSPRGLGRIVVPDPPASSGPGVEELTAVLDRAFPPVVDTVVGSPPLGPHEPAGRERTAASTPVVTSSSPPECGCGATMVRRTRRRDGQPFYGCTTFPACRRTYPISG